MGGDPERECCQGPNSTGVEETIALSGEGSCIVEARHRTAAFLTRAAAAGFGSTVSERVLGLAQLVVSELVTNACKHAPGPVLLRLRRAEAAVEVEVWDSHPEIPVAERADPYRVGRHGLEIVQAVAAEFTVLPDAAGKRVTARIDLRPSA
ncbi:ATP-binding protein [Streptomyces sp. Ag109_O5-10]|uniref:ATP-binding protein n=1 Tax=Streptomyces sp. Ag109_O5-10 TaxID=1855349 RepID=UPI0008941CC2|nr:ATP-binding protein [Streptomyces sp. Ag109_O5-10]SEE40156.1 Histidine kinase-like ATPase domain-containing protein [Streptomyces sp. Ag109_O5-10]